MAVVHFTTLPGGPYKALHVELKKNHIFCNIFLSCLGTYRAYVSLWELKVNAPDAIVFPAEDYFRNLRTIIEPPHCNAGTKSQSFI